MIERLAVQMVKHWWTFALRGALAILIGLAISRYPMQSASALVLLFGIFVFVNGVLALVAGIQLSPFGGPSWALILQGLLGLMAGVIMFFSPGIAALTLVYLVAVWAIASGMLEFVGAIAFHRVVREAWVWVLLGLASTVFGVYFIIRPDIGLGAITFTVAVYAMMIGVVLLVFGFRLRGVAKALPQS